MKLSKRNKQLIGLGALVVLIILLIKYSTSLGRLLHLIYDAMFPLILGLVIAFALNILLTRIEKIYFPSSKKKIVNASRRSVCLIASILILLLIIFAVVSLIVPEIIRAFTLLGEKIPLSLEDVAKWADKNLKDTFLSGMSEAPKLNWDEIFPKITSFITSGATGLLDSVVDIATDTIEIIFQTIIAIIFAIYLLFNKETLIKQFKKVLRAYNPYKGEKLGHYLSIANKTFSSFIVGQCLDAIILGLIIGISMALLGFPYALLTGVVVGITAWIPIVGAYLGAALGAFLIFTESPMKAIIFIVFYIVVQILEENLIYTRVVGNAVGLPSIWVLAAVTVGGGLFGVFGMIFFVPLAATIYKIMKERVNERLGNEVKSDDVIEINFSDNKKQAERK